MSKTAISRSLIGFIAVSLTCGCFSLKIPPLEPSRFPVQPKMEAYEDDDPIVGRAGDDWVITSKMMRNVTKKSLYLEEILRWKAQNGIK